MDLIDDLRARGLIHDATDLDVLRARLAQGPVGVYVGFDPTADSLHVGHLLGQVTLRRFQLAGHRPFPLAGGATGMVGDPSGRSDERNLLDRETLRHNVACIKGQLEHILDFSPGPSGATLVDNADWTEPVSLLEFLRDVGKHLTVNQMMAKESVRARMESGTGLSYTEFSYMLLQANDFRHLCEHHDVEMQMGGSDQWGNIVTGIDLIRRTLGRSAHGLTWPLLTKPDGTKFGKTAGGSVWLDPNQTSPYQFRQFWVQADDDVVDRYLLQFTLLPVDEIRATMHAHREAPERRLAQRLLARELTTMVHGAQESDRAEEAAGLLFGDGAGQESEAAYQVLSHEIPHTAVAAADLADLPGLLVLLGAAASKGEARRLMDQRGVRANGVILENAGTLSEADLRFGRFLLVRRGRRDHFLGEVTPAS